MSAALLSSFSCIACDTSGVGSSTSKDAIVSLLYSGREETLGPVLKAYEAYREHTHAREPLAKDGAVVIKRASAEAFLNKLSQKKPTVQGDVLFVDDIEVLDRLVRAEKVTTLPKKILLRVAPSFRDKGGKWVGVHARSRSLLYDKRRITTYELPESLEGLTTPRFRGKIGWCPRDASFQYFIAAAISEYGEEEASSWLRAMQENDTLIFADEKEAVDAVISGSVEAVLVNHDALFQDDEEEETDQPTSDTSTAGAKTPSAAGDPTPSTTKAGEEALEGDEVELANHFFEDQMAASITTVNAAAILRNSKHKEAATEFLAFLLGRKAQIIFEEKAHMIALAPAIPRAPHIPSATALEAVQSDRVTPNLETAAKLLKSYNLLP